MRRCRFPRRNQSLSCSSYSIFVHRPIFKIAKDMKGKGQRTHQQFEAHLNSGTHSLTEVPISLDASTEDRRSPFADPVSDCCLLQKWPKFQNGPTFLPTHRSHPPRDQRSLSVKMDRRSHPPRDQRSPSAMTNGQNPSTDATNHAFAPLGFQPIALDRSWPIFCRYD